VAESCALADSGSWELSYNATRSWPAALSECALQCKRCANCQYISFSTRERECRWFKTCTLQQNVPAFRSLEVKDMRVVKDMQQQLESELLAAPGDQHHQHPHKGSSGGGGEGEATWLVVVTSASPPFVRALAEGQLGGAKEDTLFGRGLHLPPRSSARIYHEGVPQRDINSVQRNITALWPQPVEWIDLKKVQPWVIRYVKEKADVNSSLQRDYRAGQYECICGLRWWRNGQAVGQETCKDVFTAYKIAAIYDASESIPGVNLLWLDLDMVVFAWPDSRFWSWSTLFDVATIGRGGAYPETGIIWLKASSARQRMLQLARRTLRNELLLGAAGGANDVQVFGLLFSEMVGLKVGWFATGCMKTHMRASWELASRKYSSILGRLYCPNELANVSPFNVFEYFTHNKGSGPRGKSDKWAARPIKA
jgi:hypothetical protein